MAATRKIPLRKSTRIKVIEHAENNYITQTSFNNPSHIGPPDLPCNWLRLDIRRDSWAPSFFAYFRLRASSHLLLRDSKIQRVSLDRNREYQKYQP